MSIPILSLFLFAGLLSRTESLPTTTSPKGRAYRAGVRFQLPSPSPFSWLPPPPPPPPPLAGTVGPSKKYPLICAEGAAGVAGAAVADPADTAAGLLLPPGPFSLSTRPSKEAAAVPGEAEPSFERKVTGDPVRQMTSAWEEDGGDGRDEGVFRARPGVKAVVAARLVEVGAAELGVPACVAGVLFARIRAGDGGVPAAVDGVPIPEALLLLLLLKGLLPVLGLLLVVVGPTGDEEKKLLMSVLFVKSYRWQEQQRGQVSGSGVRQACIRFGKRGTYSTSINGGGGGGVLQVVQEGKWIDSWRQQTGLGSCMHVHRPEKEGSGMCHYTGVPWCHVSNEHATC